jgi:hypothetical protein
MGNKHEKADKYRVIPFKTTGLADVNEFCADVTAFNNKINKIRDAIDLSEKNLILYLGLADLEPLMGIHYKINIKDVTMSIFYAFSAFFKGDFMKKLDMKFSDQPPYFEINIHYLDHLLRDVWLKYQKYLATLENTNHFCVALTKKYKQYYSDYYERYIEYLTEVTTNS